MADVKTKPNGGFDYDPFNPPKDRAVGLPAATARSAAAPTAEPKWKSAGFDYNPFLNPPTAVDNAPPDKSTFVGSVLRGTGGIIAGTGRALEDIGLPTKGMEAYGQQMVEEHPASVTDISGAIHDPGQFAKETAGEMAPQVGLNLGGAVTGKVIGGVLGGLGGSVIGPEGTVGGAVAGQEIGGKVGQFIPDFLQQYGNIRQAQDQEGVDDKLKALSAAAAGATVDLLNPAEMATRRLATGGLKAVTDKSLKTLGKQAVIGAATGAGTMAAQTELQRFGSGQPVTGPEAGEEAAISALKGGVAGGAIHPLVHALSPHGENLPANNQSDDSEQLALPAPDEQLALPAPSTRQGGPTLRLPGPGTDLHTADVDDILQRGIMPTESHGKTGQVSEAGALGKFQIMPSTAKEVTARLGLPYDTDRLLNDDDYGVTIAREHLSELVKEFGGDRLLAVTAYNAGAGNVRSWVRRFGYDPADPQAFLDKVRDAGNPRSAEYPTKVMAHMGVDDLGQSGADIGPPNTDEDGAPRPFDTSPKGILAFIRSEAMDPETKAPVETSATVTRLAKAIASGDEPAETAIATEQAKLNADLDKAAALPKDEADAQQADLLKRQRVLDASTEALARAKRERAGPVTPDVIPAGTPTGQVNLITEPERQAAFGRRPTLPGEPDFNPNPDLPRAAETTLAQHLLREEANSKSAEEQVKAGQAVAGKSAAEKVLRAKGLARIIADQTELNPRAAFGQHLSEVGLHPDVTAEEHGHLLAEESHRAREAANEARVRAAEEAQAQREAAAKAMPTEQQDTTLGVPSREEVAARRAPAPRAEAAPEAVPEPVAAPAPEPTPAQKIVENIRTRGETHIQNRELGPVKAKWFREGMKQAFGEEHTPPTTVKTTQENFKAGQEFVVEERAHQAREHDIEQARLAQEAEARTPPTRPTREEGIAAGLKAKGEARTARQAAKKARRAERRPPAPEKKPVVKKAMPKAVERAVALSKAREPAVAKETAAKAPEKPAEAKKPTPRTTKAIQAKAAPEPKPVTPEQTKAQKLVAERKAVAEKAVAEKATTKAEAGDRKALLADIDKSVPDSGKGGELTKWQAQHLNKLEAETIKIGGEEVPKYPLPMMEKAVALEKARYVESGRDPEVGHGETSDEVLSRVLDMAKKDTGFLTTFHPVDEGPPGRQVFADPKTMTDRELADYKQRTAAATANLRRQLDSLGLRDVAARIVPRIELAMRFGSDARGIYLPERRLVALALEQADRRETGFHEAGHALRDLDLFKPGEWRVLADYARREGILKEAQDMMPRSDPRLVEEEAVVEAWARMARDKELNPAGQAKTLFQRLSSFIEAIRNAFKGNGFITAAGVGEKITSGEIGGRERGVERMGERGYRGDALLRRDKEAPSGAPDVKYPPGRNRPEDKTRRGVLDRSARSLNVTGQHWLRQGHVLMATTKDLARMMAEHAPSAQRVVDLHSRSHAIARQFQERLVKIKDAYQALPAKLQGIGKGTVNEFLHDSTMSGKWGFKPDYQPKAEVDPKLVERFNAMPEAAQKVVKDVFQHNYDARNNLYRATVGVINTEYDPQIAAAKTDKERAILETAKARALAHFSRVFDTREGLPYTPLKREGKWAVVGMSRDYADAKERGDQKEMDRLRPDPKHYFVDFRDGVGEADALSQKVEAQFKEGDVYAFPRDKVSEGAIGGKELYVAFDQLRKGIQGEADKGSTLALRLHRLATDLYLHTLSETSARKGELGREGIYGKVEATGETPDMMKAFVSRGNATANYVASMSSNPQMQAALDGMHREVSQLKGTTRTNVQRMHNEMMARYVNNLSWQPNRVVDKLVHGVTGWNLLSSPFYYMQNATQAVLISHPIMAGRFGYGRATAEMGKAYVDFAKATNGIKLGDRIDFAKFPEQDLMQFLAERGHLDAGYQQEFNSWDGANGDMFPAAWGKASRFFRQMPQRVEIMNRAVSGLAAFRAALKDGMSREEAMAYAGKLIDDTHGDYSGFNSPRPFNTNVGKVMLQFRKFQLIMGGLVGKQFHQAFFDKTATRAERVQAIKGMVFLGAHLAAIGGIMGMPGTNFVGAAFGTVQNLLDPNQHKDWQEELREALGAGGEGAKRDPWHDFLYKGAPYALLGMDTSDRIGMGNVFSLAPYLDMPSSNKEKAFSNLAKFMLGPSGGLLGKLYDGWGFAVDQHDWERAAESIAPAGIGNALQAYRLKTQGLTNKRGDVLMQPEDISGMDAFYTAIGVRPTSLVNQADRASVAYDTTEFYKLKSQNLANDYAAAFKAKDTAKMQDLRNQFKDLQDARVGQKLKREPMSSLIKAPHAQMKRERSVIGGVESSKANRMYLADLMFADSPAEAQALMQP